MYEPGGLITSRHDAKHTADPTQTFTGTKSWERNTMSKWKEFADEEFDPDAQPSENEQAPPIRIDRSCPRDLPLDEDGHPEVPEANPGWRPGVMSQILRSAFTLAYSMPQTLL